MPNFNLEQQNNNQNEEVQFSLDKWSSIKTLISHPESLDRLVNINECFKGFDFLESPKLEGLIGEWLEEKKNNLNTNLENLGREDLQINNSEWEEGSLVNLAQKLTSTSGLLLREVRENQSKKDDVKNELELAEVKSIVEDQYGFPLDWFTDNISIEDPNAQIMDSISELNSVEISEMNKETELHAKKKLMIDFYIHGKSLNDLGAFYSYFSDQEWSDTSLNRALSDSLHLTNTLYLGIISQNENLLNVINSGAGMAGLGRMEFKNVNNNEIKADVVGLSPTELSHELVKSLFEYLTLDTSLPAEGEIDNEQASALSNFVHQPVIEIISGFYGPVISKKIDEGISEVIQSAIRDGKGAKLSRLININKDELVDSNHVKARLFKLVSMMNNEDLSSFYLNAVNGQISKDNWLSKLETSSNEFNSNL